MRDRERWHLSEEAIYEYLDRTLGPAARAETQRHLRSCPKCAGQLQRAARLFSRIESAEEPRLDRDLSGGVVAGLQAARLSRRRWNRVLLAEGAVAAGALAVLGLRFEGWLEAVLHQPAYQSLREQGLRLAAQAAAWFAPFFHLIPVDPSRFTFARITVPHLEGPVLGWAGLGIAALALGLVGNMLLLRSGDGRAGKVLGSEGPRQGRSARSPRGSGGGAK